MESIKSKVEQIQLHIKTLEMELNSIRSICNHSSTVIKDINPQGSSELRRVCKSCGTILGYPSQNDVDSWLS